MYEDLREMVEGIVSDEQELENVVQGVTELDRKRVQVIIAIAIHGLKFEKIWSFKQSVNTTDSEICPDEYEQLKREDDTFIKGVRICTYRGDRFSKDVVMLKEDLYELWLLSDGTFMSTHMTGSSKNEQWGVSKFTREVIMFHADPFETKELLFIWDSDVILSSIITNINSRYKDLKSRTKIQEERLEKLKALQLI